MADIAELAILLRLNGLGDFRSGIQSAASGLKEFGQSVKVIGTDFLLAGGAIMGFGALSMKTFADTATTLHDMAIKTGFSTEALSELKYAADMTNTSLGTIQIAFRSTSNLVEKAANNEQAAVATLKQLGLSYSQLKGMKPEDAFFAVANSVANETDAMKRASLATIAFGRSGLELLPLLAGGQEGLAAMRDEAHKLGLVYDEDMVDKGVKVAESMKQIKATGQELMASVATALTPAFVSFANTLVGVIKGFSDWAKQNPELVKTIETVGIAMVSLGLAIKVAAMAQAFLLALSGPAGWAILAGAAAATTAAVIAMNKLSESAAETKANVAATPTAPAIAPTAPVAAASPMRRVFESAGAPLPTAAPVMTQTAKAIIAPPTEITKASEAAPVTSTAPVAKGAIPIPITEIAKPIPPLITQPNQGLTEIAKAATPSTIAPSAPPMPGAQLSEIAKAVAPARPLAEIAKAIAPASVPASLPISPLAQIGKAAGPNLSAVAAMSSPAPAEAMAGPRETTINITVEGSILSPDGLADSVTPAIRRVMSQIDQRNTPIAWNR